MRTREPVGKYSKTLILKVTGTNRPATLRVHVRADKGMPREKDTGLKDIEPKQAVVLVDWIIEDTPLLLTAIVRVPEVKSSGPSGVY